MRDAKVGPLVSPPPPPTNDDDDDTNNSSSVMNDSAAAPTHTHNPNCCRSFLLWLDTVVS